ncbi:type 2 phosphatidic acid phosphatase family protein [Paenibacillus pini JCM 16418]|uniref:Type 2 phosphatidic acid phosphatase family protein n=2 Tax=Paenibacillus TaxID=44249 RepID=W7YWE8_9BACL|nr:type 2 phosphatidic acid phosphatase family protein [Paenibacillus pini JCM 16418]
MIQTVFWVAWGIKTQMNLKWRLTKAFGISLIFIVLFGIVALGIGLNKIAWFDQFFIHVVQGMENEKLTSVMKWFTSVGSSGVVIPLTIIVMVLLFVLLKHRRELILLIWVLAGSEILNVILKMIFHRTRPDTHRLIDISGFSFPSGHSMGAFSLYGVLAYLLWRHIPSAVMRVVWVIFCALMILMIGVSRIYLGVHYPSDVLGGYLISAFWLTLSIGYFAKGKQKGRS